MSELYKIGNSVVHFPGGIFQPLGGELYRITQWCVFQGGELYNITKWCTFHTGELYSTTELTHELSDVWNFSTVGTYDTTSV